MSIDHDFLKPIQLVVNEVVEPMQSLVNLTLLLESDESTKVVEQIQSSVDPTLILWSDVFVDHVFNISHSKPSSSILQAYFPQVLG